MPPKYFIGMDISKTTIDIGLVSGLKFLWHGRIPNKEKSINEALIKLRKDFKATRLNSLICAEYMGLYTTFLEKSCLKKKYPVCLESSLRIKRSIGISRGKSDAIDAKRIAFYAAKNWQSLRNWEPLPPKLYRLQLLLTIRKRLLKVGSILISERKVLSYYLSQKEMADRISYTSHSIEAVQEDIRKIELEMGSLVDSDKQLSHLMQIMLSVPGIGFIVGVSLLIVTRGFTNNMTARQYASYCGIAPFAETSGTSKRLKPRVSSIGNRDVKTLLHMPVISALKSKNTFLYRYYSRKIAEGKKPRSVFNAMKNKLIGRVFACVRDNHFYEEPNFVPSPRKLRKIRSRYLAA